MKFALLYFYDPARAGPAGGEVDDWLALDAEIKGNGRVPLRVRRRVPFEGLGNNLRRSR
jgi:hypothetical protein